MFSQPRQENAQPSKVDSRHLPLEQVRADLRSLASRLRLIRLAIVLPLALALAACGNIPLLSHGTPTPTEPTPTAAPPTATPEPMAATVNGEGITVQEFRAQVTAYQSAQTSLGKTVSEQDASKAVIEDLIAQVLLAQAARAAGFRLTDAALQAAIDALQEQAGGAAQLARWEQENGYATPADFESGLRRSLEAAWMRDKIVSAVPRTAEQVHVQQILLYNEGDANSVLEQLKVGGDFNALAVQYDPNTRGDLGWFPRGYLLEPKIEAAAFSLPAGQYSDVIQTAEGYCIIKVLEKDPNHPLAPDAYLALQQLALKDWVTKARSTATVVLAP